MDREEKPGFGTLVKTEGVQMHKDAALIPEQCTKNEQLHDHDGRKDLCLVCFKVVIGNDGDTVQWNQTTIRDLFRVFQISSCSIDQLFLNDLPLRLFCEDCTDRIVDAVQLVSRIDCLQKDLKVLKNTLRGDIVRSELRRNECEFKIESINNVRKTLIQCFSPCQVVINPVSTSYSCERVPVTVMLESNPEEYEETASEFQVIDDDFLQLLSPMTILTPEVMKRESRGFYRRGGTTSGESDEDNQGCGNKSEVFDDDYQQSSGDEELNENEGDYTPIIKQKRIRKSTKRSNLGTRGRRKGRPRKDFLVRCLNCSRGFNSEEALHKHMKWCHGKKIQGNGKPEGPSIKRLYGEDGKLNSFECPFCERKQSREEYFCSETGKYVFKCFPECCDKIMDNFPNLVVHHDSLCPSKPIELQSITRRASKKQPKPVTAESNKNESIINVTNGFLYDENKAVIGFRCPGCDKEMLRSTFCQASGEYIFKCDWDSCDKTTTTLSNLAYHHATHCSNRPRRRRRKYPKKPKISGDQAVVEARETDISPSEFQGKSAREKTANQNLKSIQRRKGRPKKVFPFNCEKCGKGFMSDRVLSLHESNHIKLKNSDGGSVLDKKNSPYRIYDENGKLFSYDCPFCQRKFSEQDYIIESGTYLFKCFPDCCDKVVGKFISLVYHHEAFCPAKPLELFSNKRKYRRKTREARERGSEKRHRYDKDFLDSVLSDLSSIHHLYDTDGNLVAFNCPFCEKKLALEEYVTESGYNFKCSADDDCVETMNDFSSLVTHHKSCCPMIQRARQISTEPRIPAPKSGIRTYDESNKLISYECTFCQRSMFRDTYKTEHGNYIFKCFPECCDKVMDHFSNLVSHHSAYCNSKPSGLYSKTRQSQIIPKRKDSPDCTQTCEAEMEQTVTPIKTGRRIYDDNNKLICFECPFCQKNISKQDYFNSEVGDYLFKCIPACCEKVTDNFPNLVYHHEAYCPCKPLSLYSKKTHRRLKERSKTGTSNEIIKVSKGFKYDDSKVVTSFECPRCQKQMAPSDFRIETGEIIYKCGWNLCDKVCTTFANLAYHHEAHCSDRPKKPKWKPPKKEKKVKVVKEEEKGEKKPKIKQKNTDPVYCDQCGKAFKKKFDLARHMITHSDERPFACDQCPYTCKRSKNLRIHMRMHSDERPFLCSTCGKTFRSSSSLNHHEKTHGTENFPCLYCNRLFKSQNDLDTHVMRIHRQETVINYRGDQGPSGYSTMNLHPNNPYGNELDLGSLWNPMY